MSGPQEARDATGSAKALVKGLSLVNALAGSPDGLRLTQLVQRADLPRATVVRLLDALLDARLVRCADDGLYRVGPQCAIWGSSFLASLELRQFASDVMIRLGELSGETCHLGVQEAGRVLYVHKVESPHALRMVSRIGGTNPLHSTALGKAILAFLPPDEAETYLAGPLERRTPNTITDYQAWMGELGRIRERGYAVDDVENELGVRCIGAPIFDHERLLAGSLSIAGPTLRMTWEKVDTLVGPLQQAAAEVSARLGYGLAETQGA